MNDHWLINLAQKIQPELATEKNSLRRLLGIVNILGTLLTMPLLLLGFIWQTQHVNWQLILEQGWLLPILFAFDLFFSVTKFRLQIGILKGNFIYADGSLSSLTNFAALLLFGPFILWFYLLVQMLGFGIGLRGVKSRYVIWHQGRSTVQQITIAFLGGNLSLWVYEQLNGRYPLPGFDTQSMVAAFSAGVVFVLMPLIILSVFFKMVDYVNKRLGRSQIDLNRSYTHNGLIGILLPSITAFFGILLAGIYTTLGLGVMLFFLLATVGFALLANRLSRTNAQMEQHSRELAQLEKMGQAIVNSPLDTSVLPAILEEHVPDMLPGLRIRIWLLPDQILLERSINPLPEITAVAHLLDPTKSEPISLDKIIPAKSPTSMHKQSGFVFPITSDTQQLLGGILVISTSDNFQAPQTKEYFPSIQALGSQVASALHRVEVYKDSVASEKMARELEIAGQIQATFLPNEVPQLSGWQLTAKIEPARQTSGDFYDFVDLGNGRLAIIVADVADKGTGAALYMALSRTLIRTYAITYPGNPEKALQAANERILEDTKSDQFVTVFFAILDSNTHQLVYANAGHNPAYLFNQSGAPQSLSHTGIPLGMFEGMAWKRNSVDVAADDVLVIYTDGVTEAPNAQDEEFGEDRLIETVNGMLGKGHSAAQIEQSILNAVHTFVGDTPAFDDITLLVAACQ